MGWLEFTVIIVCGLFGFIVMNAVIDARRAKAEGHQNNGGAKNKNSGANKDEDASQKPGDRQRRTEKEGSPRSWWETLNVDQYASPEQIKSAFRKEISKYHPDRVEGLGIELRELADRMAKKSTAPIRSPNNNEVSNRGEAGGSHLESFYRGDHLGHLAGSKSEADQCDCQRLVRA